MKIVFSKNSSALSRFIRWLSGEDVSHMALVFDEKILFQSNLIGCHVSWYPTFLKSNDVVYDIDYEMSLEVEERIYQSVITRFDGRGYDYMALIYFILCGVSSKLFGTKLPDSNKWGNGDRFLCTELASVLPEPISIRSRVDLMTPYQVYLDLKNSREGR